MRDGCRAAVLATQLLHNVEIALGRPIIGQLGGARCSRAVGGSVECLTTGAPDRRIRCVLRALPPGNAKSRLRARSPAQALLNSQKTLRTLRVFTILQPSAGTLPAAVPPHKAGCEMATAFCTYHR